MASRLFHLLICGSRKEAVLQCGNRVFRMVEAKKIAPAGSTPDGSRAISCGDLISYAIMTKRSLAHTFAWVMLSAALAGAQAQQRAGEVTASVTHATLTRGTATHT